MKCMPTDGRRTIPLLRCVTGHWVSFNRCLYTNLLYIKIRTVLHVVDLDTKYSAECLFSGESSSDIWDALLMIWVSSYVGFPDLIAIDQGTQFTNDEWATILAAPRIAIRQPGVESHNIFGVGERYHSYLRQIYQRVQLVNLKITQELAIRVLNDMEISNSLTLTLTILGVISRVPTDPRHFCKQLKRVNAMSSARDEIVKSKANGRIKIALIRNVPAASDAEINIGDELPMFRRKPGPKCEDPYNFFRFRG